MDAIIRGIEKRRSTAALQDAKRDKTLVRHPLIVNFHQADPSAVVNSSE